MIKAASLTRSASRVAKSAITSGGRQNFLGARWVTVLVACTPKRFRERLVLRLLALSPHYFFSADLAAEHARCIAQREALTEQLLASRLDPTMVALDYGCGPGYMAVAVARRARRVEAIDISAGVLACAQVINGAPNVVYATPAEASDRTEPIDIAYSIAVVQHMDDDTFREMLLVLKRRLRPGGTLVLHFALPVDGWRTEDEWRADDTFGGRMKLRFGLNCFGRGVDHVERIVTEAGFNDVVIEPLAERTDADAQISAQHWLVATT